MNIEVKYFGRIAEVLHAENETLRLKGTMSVLEFKDFLCSRCQTLENESFKIAVNMKLVEDDYEITEDCELAILPPFAGG